MPPKRHQSVPNEINVLCRGRRLRVVRDRNIAVDSGPDAKQAHQGARCACLGSSDRLPVGGTTAGVIYIIHRCYPGGDGLDTH
jgi:hypothetical protein